MLFSPFLFVSFYIWPERIDSVADLHYATVLLQEPITRWGQSLEELVREMKAMKAPGNQLLTRAIM